MTTRRKQITAITATVGLALIILAWHPPTVTGSADCNQQTGIQTGHVKATNDEGETATVRQSTGPVFVVGDTIGAHASKTESFTKPGTFSGNITMSFAVNFPSDHTMRNSSVTVHFPGGCTTPPPPTTTTSTTAPPTTSTTAPAPPTTDGPTTTTSTPPEIIPPADVCADDGVVTAAPVACVAEPGFTG